ncbi:ESX secretion-associated protein EspG [Amycolatopsis antarctica]|uniref:ESX secretion-associated protein EspG n=1 Tax=Amycolatopsis antarctica TaxID=1854586 RepID=A0A263D7S2_9PSEU|nr:ESX secretion-associated protein EspG [Amycolatopsis antarctica]
MDLPLAALATIAEREGAGELHMVLRPEAMWLSDNDREAAARTAQEALVAAGLLDGRGRLDVDFLDWLPVLTMPNAECYGWYTVDGETRGALAAARGLEGVLAIRSGDRVRLTAVNRDLLAEALVAELPEVVPGGGTPWSVSLEELRDAGDGRRAVDRRLSRHLAEVVKVVQRPVHGSGELYAATRDEVGRRSQTVDPLHYVDTDWGRYLNHTSGTGAGARLNIAPATPSALAATLRGLHRS